MKFRYSKKAVKDLAKLDKKIESAFYKRLELYVVDPRNTLLNFHYLQGKYLGMGSFNVTGDFRCIISTPDLETTMIERIGSHSQLY